uniref:V1 n=1 Tax=Tomato yellow leaf curl virus TaxID=10832 RepID=A0A2S1CHK7_9GEMI|nr:V1 [Tomato yellow leaf curl virus]
MSKRPGDIIISTPVSKVRRRLNFDSPYSNRAAVPIVQGTNKRRSWTYRPMYRKPRIYRMYRSPDVPRGCEDHVKSSLMSSEMILSTLVLFVVLVMLLVDLELLTESVRGSVLNRYIF